MDVGALSGLAEAPDGLRTFRRACVEAWSIAEEMPKPVICAIQGACIGGALELALACDFRVLAADAMVGMPEAAIGLIPDVGGCSRLPQVVGLGRAKELIMTGRLIGAEEAERIGLANRVALQEELDAAVQRLADELLACAPVAVGLAKRVMDASARPALAATLELEVVAQERCAATADFAEGTRALREKRRPEFSGR
jgi:enoyl-CoA hydratase/carnithine racemase